MDCMFYAAMLTDPLPPASNLWGTYMAELDSHLRHNCTQLDNSRTWNPTVFMWPERAAQGYAALKDPEWPVIEDGPLGRAVSHTEYGPKGVHTVRLHNYRIQLDKVQHIWTLHMLLKEGFDVYSTESVFVEFGGGTGQMALVLQEIGYSGKHIVVDFRQMQLYQRYFLHKVGVSTQFIESIDDAVQGSTSYLAPGKPLYGTFVATYSITETDETTRNTVLKYMPRFDYVYIVYWGSWELGGDHIDNHVFIRRVREQLQHNHTFTSGRHFSNGHYLIAVPNTSR